MFKKIPSEVLDEIRSSVDIIDVIGEQVSLRKAGRNYSGLCPFHQEENTLLFCCTGQAGL